MCCYTGNHGADTQLRKVEMCQCWASSNICLSCNLELFGIKMAIYKKNWVHSTLSGHAGLDLLVHLELALSDVQDALWQRHLLGGWHLVRMSRWKWCRRAARNKKKKIGGKDKKWRQNMLINSSSRWCIHSHDTLYKLQVTDFTGWLASLHALLLFLLQTPICLCEYSEL